MALDPSSTAAFDFAALDDFLMSDRAPEECMQLSDLDGFLTGIAVSPDMLLPSEWLPVIWGGGEPEFDSAEEAKVVLDTIFRRYNAIIQALEQQPDSYQPILWGTPDGRRIAEDWIDGFLAAVSLRQSSWDAIWLPENLPVIAPIAAFCHDRDGRPCAGDDAGSVAEIQEKMLDLLPESVVAIHRFWKRRRAGPPQPSRPARPAAKAGRNDPCPCGSGKKYKRCCGAP